MKIATSQKAAKVKLSSCDGPQCGEAGAEIETVSGCERAANVAH